MPTISSSISVSWLNHSAWSEKYVGLRRMAFGILPENTREMTSEDIALCQSVVVGSSQLIEMAFFEIIERYVGTKVSKKDYDLQYFKALISLPSKIVGRNIDLTQEPFLSSEKLRKRRNSTVHKESLLADVKIARSALYTAVNTVFMLYEHFGLKFPYSKFLNSYPIDEKVLFSNVITTENHYIGTFA